MPKALKRWETLRQEGKLKFILVRGVLSWGMPMFAVMTFVINKPAEGRKDPWWLIYVSAAIWAAGGALFGWALWILSEKRYRKYLESRAGKAASEPQIGS